MILFLWIFIAVYSSAITGQRSSFQSCLTSIADLKTITSSDPTYSNASQPFNLRLTPSPEFIVYPSSPNEISHLVTCAAAGGMNVSVRSGGHSYAAYGLSGNLVIDLINLKNLTIDDSGLAKAQTGLLLGELAEGLWNQGQRALPHGTCPYVGIGGHPLYGGFGFYSRTAGLLLDRIVSADVVLANGTTVTASNTTNIDLFWALRGGGASFGIVTSWTFDTLPAPPTTVYYQITFFLPPSKDETVAAFDAWQQFGLTAPKELSMTAVLAPASNTQLSLGFSGTYYGSLDQFNAVIEPLLDSLPPSRTINSQALSWLDGLIAADGKLDTSTREKSNTFYAKSLVTKEPASNASVISLVDYLFDVGLSTNTTWFAQADVYGGIISSVPADATAFAHRDAFLVYQFYANAMDKLPPFPSDGVSLVDNMLRALEPNPKAAYPNYIDPNLTRDEWETLYFGDHIDRLEQVKREVDPKNVFNFQQAILPQSTSTGATSSPGNSNSSAAIPSVPSIKLGLFIYISAYVFLCMI